MSTRSLEITRTVEITPEPDPELDAASALIHLMENNGLGFKFKSLSSVGDKMTVGFTLNDMPFEIVIHQVRKTKE